MNFFTGKIKCVHCGHEATGKDVFVACPKCAEKGLASNYSTVYDYTGYTPEQIKEIYHRPSKAKGVWRHREFLPVAEDAQVVSIGEGQTPLVHCEKLGAMLGCSNLYVKIEGGSTSGSYKDRLAAVGVSRALQEGAKVVVGSSTGNHGAAVAAYATRAGLDCVIFTVPQVPKTMKTLMQAFGACVIETPTFADRYIMQHQCVMENDWYPLTGFVAPPIGSNPYGVDGYKTIAFEIFDELGTLPDFIAIPNGYADGLYGTWKGVQDLHQNGICDKSCRMIASEVYDSLTQTLAEGGEDTVAVPTRDWTVAFSIGGGKATQQGYAALKESNGLAADSADEETMAMQLLLGKTEGIYAETASVTTLVAIGKLIKQGKIKPDETVVAVLTSTGLKDPDTTADHLPKVPFIQRPEKDLLEQALKDYYHRDLL